MGPNLKKGYLKSFELETYLGTKVELTTPSVPWDTTLDSGKEELNSVTKSAGVANISECSQYTQTNMLKILTYIHEKSRW